MFLKDLKTQLSGILQAVCIPFHDKNLLQYLLILTNASYEASDQTKPYD